MKNIKKFLLIIIALLLITDCVSSSRAESMINSDGSIKVEVGKIFGEPKTSDTNEIQAIMVDLISNIQNSKIDILLNYIHPEKGIYLDLKGLWEYNKIKKEISSKDSYFEIFFFNHEKLSKHKKSKDVMTVKEIIESSKGIYMDMFFEDKSNCEIKLRFAHKNKYENDLINPYFIKIKDKWYIHRLF